MAFSPEDFKCEIPNLKVVKFQTSNARERGELFVLFEHVPE